MKNIEVSKIIEPVATSDGAGVKLKRSIGTHLIDYHDPFLMLDEFGSENKDDYIGGFPPHPHRGIETVTYMLCGEFEHEDSTGAKGRMSAGDVQWMKTGGGIIHSEMPVMSEGKLHGFQLWVNMPAKLKMNKPEYIHIDAKQMKVHKDSEKKIKIIAVEPEDSPVLSGGSAGPHKIQGIGAGFVPKILNKKSIDEIIQIANETAFSTAKMAAKVEGLPIGISSGAALAAGIEVAQRKEMKDKRIIIVIPSFAERYLSTPLFN